MSEKGTRNKHQFLGNDSIKLQKNNNQKNPLFFQSPKYGLIELMGKKKKKKKKKKNKKKEWHIDQYAEPT